MPSHVIDSAFFKDYYGTDEMRAVFEDMSLLQRWLDVEAALARAEADLGLIPSEAAREITRKAQARRMDVRRIKASLDRTVHPLMGQIKALAEACEADSGEYVHWGATTQDIMDTAVVLQLKEALNILEGRLEELISVLSDLAAAHRETIMAGRTHGQQALPITFGFKVAVWLMEVGRHRQRMLECRPRLLVGQLAGAAGTLASLSASGLLVQERMMGLLGLGVPVISWQTARDGYGEFAACLGMLAATLVKIGREVIALQKTELGEVEEPFNEGEVGSSTMPHKRNPMLCEAIVAAGRLVMRNVPMALEGMVQEHERDMAAWHMEWSYLPEMCIQTDGALNLTLRVLRGLVVKPERMQANLLLQDGLMLSEAVMLELAALVGRQTAHELVYTCAMSSVEEGRPFRETLIEHPTVSRFLTSERIDQLLDPGRYTGLADQFVDRVLEAMARGEGPR